MEKSIFSRFFLYLKTAGEVPSVWIGANHESGEGGVKPFPPCHFLQLSCLPKLLAITTEVPAFPPSLWLIGILIGMAKRNLDWESSAFGNG